MKKNGCTIKRLVALLLCLTLCTGLVPVETLAYVGPVTDPLVLASVSRQDSKGKDRSFSAVSLKNDYICFELDTTSGTIMRTVPSRIAVGTTLASDYDAGVYQELQFVVDSQILVVDSVTVSAEENGFEVTYTFKDTEGTANVGFHLIKAGRGKVKGTATFPIRHPDANDDERTYIVHAICDFDEESFKASSYYMNVITYRPSAMGHADMQEQASLGACYCNCTWGEQDANYYSIRGGLSKTGAGDISELMTVSYNYANPFFLLGDMYHNAYGPYQEEDGSWATGITNGIDGQYALDYLAGNVSYIPAAEDEEDEAAAVSDVLIMESLNRPFMGQAWGFRDLYTAGETLPEIISGDEDYETPEQTGTKLAVIPKGAGYEVKELAERAGVPADAVAVFQGSYTWNPKGEYFDLASGIAISPTTTVSFEPGGYLRLKRDGTILCKDIDLNVPAFTFYKSKGKTDAKQPSFAYSKEDKQLVITLDPNNNAAVIGIDIPYSTAEVGAVKLSTAGDVNFSGAVTILTAFEAPFKLHQLGYGLNDQGKFKLKGLEAEADIEDADLFGLELNKIYGNINTFTGYYVFELNVNAFDLLSFAANLELARTNSGALVPNNLYGELIVKSAAGIPLIPPAPIASVNGGGIGFSNLVQTLNGDYLMIPPLKVKGMLNGSIVEVIKGRLEVTAGPSGIDIAAKNLRIPDENGIDLIDEIRVYFGVEGMRRTYKGTTYTGVNVKGGLKTKLSVLKDRTDDDDEGEGDKKTSYNNVVVVDGSLELNAFGGVDSDKTRLYLMIDTSGRIRAAINTPEGWKLIGGTKITETDIQFVLGAQTVANIDGTTEEMFASALANINPYIGLCWTANISKVYGRIYYVAPKTVDGKKYWVSSRNVGGGVYWGDPGEFHFSDHLETGVETSGQMGARDLMAAPLIDEETGDQAGMIWFDANMEPQEIIIEAMVETEGTTLTQAADTEEFYSEDGLLSPDAQTDDAADLLPADETKAGAYDGFTDDQPDAGIISDNWPDADSVSDNWSDAGIVSNDSPYMNSLEAEDEWAEFFEEDAIELPDEDFDEFAEEEEEFESVYEESLLYGDDEEWMDEIETELTTEAEEVKADDLEYDPNDPVTKQIERINSSIDREDNLILQIMPADGVTANTDEFLAGLSVDDVPVTMLECDEEGNITREGNALIGENEESRPIYIFLDTYDDEGDPISTWTISSQWGDFEAELYKNSPFETMDVDHYGNEMFIEAKGLTADQYYELHTYYGFEKGDGAYVVDQYSLNEGNPVDEDGYKEAVYVPLPAEGTFAETGDYYVTTTLMQVLREDFNGDGEVSEDEIAYIPVSSYESDTTISFTNPNTPAAPAFVSIEATGNETLTCSFSEVDNADGFKIGIYQYGEDTGYSYEFDVEGDMLAGALDQNVQHESGVWTLRLNPTVGSTGAIDDETQSEDLLQPGDGYSLVVSAYRYLDQDTKEYPVYSAQIMSNTVELPEYQEADLDISINGENLEADPDTGMYTGTIGSADQTWYLEIVANGSPSDNVYSFELTRNDGETAYDQVVGYNSDPNYVNAADFRLSAFDGVASYNIAVTNTVTKDVTRRFLTLSADTVAPILTLDAASYAADADGYYEITGTGEAECTIEANGADMVIGEDGKFSLAGSIGQQYWELVWKSISYLEKDEHTVDIASKEDFDGLIEFENMMSQYDSKFDHFAITPSEYSPDTAVYTVTEFYRFEKMYTAEEYQAMITEAQDPASGISDVQVVTNITEETNGSTVDDFREMYSNESLEINGRSRVAGAALTVTETDDAGNSTTAMAFVNAHIHDLEKLPEALYESCVNYRCRTCGKIFTDAGGLHEADTTVPAKDHVPAAMHQMEADCTHSGFSGGSYCQVCGEVLQASASVPAAGHAFGGWTVTKQPSVSAEGTATRTCSRCGYQETKSVSKTKPAHTHAFGGWKVTKQATVLEKGVMTRTCTVCGEPEKKSIPKLKASLALQVGSIKVSGTTVPLKKKQKLSKIEAVMLDGDSILSAASANDKICKVTVSGNKVVLKAGKKTGKTTITVQTKAGANAAFKVKIQNKTVKAKKLVGFRKKLTMKKGQIWQIPKDVSPVSTPGKLKFKSSDKSVATVNKKGLIKAKKKGSATITVTIGKKKFTCKVKVK